MSQNITLLGASYSDVPSVLLPKTGGGTAQFDDTTIASNAAAAADIAQGKLAYVNGSLVTGTNQGGGGGGALKVGVLRPDAVLEQSWTYDKKVHADEGVTIPSYSTSEQTLKASSSLVTNKQLDNTQYDYFVAYRGIATPIYSSSTKGAGRCIYSVCSYGLEISCVPSSYITVDGATSDRYVSSSTTYSSSGAVVYWRSASAMRATAGTAYGAYLSMVTPTFSSSYNGTPTITIASPKLCMKGSTTYLNSTYWSYITDIRFQYIFELWKIPRTGTVNGMVHTSQLVHAVNCAQSANGTLT